MDDGKRKKKKSRIGIARVGRRSRRRTEKSRRKARKRAGFHVLFQ